MVKGNFRRRKKKAEKLQSELLQAAIESSSNEDESDISEMRLAATILDECETEGQREEYIKELQKYTSVHIYGRCGAPCPGWVTEDCLKYLDKHYKVRPIMTQQFVIGFE